ncbi:MAG: gamma-glutamyltransferase [Mariprofundaceae bacterium]
MKYCTVIFIMLSSFFTSAIAATVPMHGMVVSAHTLATQAGENIMARGGSAFDAAAATALALGVVEPGSSGIGGGGFFLLYIADKKRYVMVDARETSPALAGNGKIYKSRSSIDGPQAAGVPGLLAGIDHILQRYGSLNRQQVATPAIKLARNGFQPGSRLQRMLSWRKDAFNDAAQQVFLAKTIRQPALADTLQRYVKHGVDDFYRGETAGRLVADMKRDGGLIREEDLAAYHVIERVPVTFNFQGYQFVSTALPSSGGLVLAEVFGMLKHDDLNTMKEADRTHLLIEAMRRAYRDRNENMGDSDFVDIPNLLDARRLQRLRASIDMRKATPSESLGNKLPANGDGANTTHFSVIDKYGNMVSATLSINYGFGSAYLSPATGILLNDEMDDFATKPGEANAYGLVQGKANAVAPGKRMLSSMSPTFVSSPTRTFIVGTPGGSRIISMVLLASLGFMADNSDAQQWIDRPRFHHQFLPDVVQHELGAFSQELAKALRARGHQLKERRNYGNMQAILFDKRSRELTRISDIRGKDE